MSKETREEVFARLGAQINVDEKAYDLEARGVVFTPIAQGAGKSQEEQTKMDSLALMIADVDNNGAPSQSQLRVFARGLFGLNEVQTEDMIHSIETFSREDIDPQAAKAGIKIALYHNLLSERGADGKIKSSNAASEKISDVIADYVSSTNKSPKELREDVFEITSPVVHGMTAKNMRRLLQDTATKIVDTFGDKNASIGFKERVGKILRSFVDMLPTVREASKLQEKLHGYVAGPATAQHRAAGKQEKRGQGRVD